MKIIIGCDHRGYDLKVELLKYLKNAGYYVSDAGCNNVDAIDYPLIAKAVCEFGQTEDGEI